jgi:hypothetical protein
MSAGRARLIGENVPICLDRQAAGGCWNRNPKSLNLTAKTRPEAAKKRIDDERIH